jgi:hypothetical protein
VNFSAKEGAEEMRKRLREEAQREDLGLSGSVWLRTDVELLEEGLSLYLSTTNGLNVGHQEKKLMHINL